MATKNLDAEAVNKVQVFDKKSEEAEFTGIDDGEREKSINLELKEGMKNKNFGKIELAGGLEERHKGKLNFNRFNPAYQFSTILSGNNINENPLNFNEYLNSIGGLGQLGGSDGMMNELINNQNINRGIHSNYTGGINFSTTKWKNIKWYNNYKGKYHGSTLFENSDIIRRNPAAQWNEINESSHLAQNMSHSGFSKVKWNPNKQRELSSKVAATFGARNEQLIQDISFLQLNEIFNSQLFQNNTNFLSNNISAEINYRQKMKKKGRNFSLMANFQRGSNISEDRIVSETWLSPAEKWRTSMLYQEQQVQSALNYTEPIKGPYFLKLQSSISSNLQAPQLSSFDLEGNNELINDAFSGEASRSFNLWNNRLHLKKQSKKWKYDIGLGHAMSQILLNVRDLQRPTGTKHFFLPSFSSKYKLKGMKNIRMDYSTSLRSPNVQQLATIPNRDNINRLELGNESLKPEYNHRLNISYNSFNNYNYASFFISMNYDYSPNKILQSTRFINPTEFITQSIHTENYHNASLTISKGGKTPWVRCKYNLSSSLGLAQYSNQINEIEVTSRPILGNISARIENRKKEKIDWMTGYDLNLNYVVNDGGLNSKNTFTNHSWYLDIIWNISDSWEWRSKYDYSLFYNNGIKSGVDIHLLNFTLSKSFKDGKYTFNADVSDALNQRVGFEQIGGINNESTIRYNVLQRVVMLGFRYKI